MQGRAFIAGATGYTGSHLVRILRERGWEVHAHIRPDSSSFVRWKDEWEAVGAHLDATPWEESAITQTLRRIAPTHVFAMLGTTKARARAASGAVADTYEAVDYGLSAMLLRATRAAEPAARYVYLSSLGVRPGTRNAYIQARARLEEELRESGLDYVIVRPALITGDDRPENRGVEKISKPLIGGALALVGVFSEATKRTLMTRDGRLLAEGCADAAELAPSGAELDGNALDSLRG